MPKVLALVADDTKAVFKKGHVEVRELGPNDVSLKVQYCGVCHSDVHQVRGEWPIDTLYPMVPGHEIVGIVDAVGPKVTKHKVGDRVGVGCLVGSCRSCDECHRDLEQYCVNDPSPTYNGKLNGNLTFGGYSERMVVDEHFVLKVPDGMDLSKVGPLLCAGVTTWSPLVHFGALEAGSKFHVGVHGFGGLGHMAVKLAIAMGCTVTVISRGTRKQKAAEALGAKFLDSTDAKAMKDNKRTMNLIVSTVCGDFDGWEDILKLCKTDSVVALVGVPPKPCEIEPFGVIGARRSFAGSNIGGIKETQDMLNFCAAKGVYPEVTLVDAKEINRVHADLFEGSAGDVFRFVIKIKDTLTEGNWEVAKDPRTSKESWIVRGNVEPVTADKHKNKHLFENRKKSKYHGHGVSTAMFCIAMTSLAVAAGYLIGQRRSK